MWEAVRKRLFGQDAATEEQPASEAPTARTSDQDAAQAGPGAPQRDLERGTPAPPRPGTGASSQPDVADIDISPPGHAPQGLAAEAAPLGSEAEATSATTATALDAWSEAAAPLPETAPPLPTAPPAAAPAEAGLPSGATPELDLDAATRHAQEVAAEAAAQAQELAAETAAHAEDITSQAAAHAQELTADAASQAASAPQTANAPETAPPGTPESAPATDATAPPTPAPQARAVPEASPRVAQSPMAPETASPVAAEATLPTHAEPEPTPDETTGPAGASAAEPTAPAGPEGAETTMPASVEAETAEAEATEPGVETAQEAAPISGEEAAAISGEEAAAISGEATATDVGAAPATGEEAAPVTGDEAAPAAPEATEATQPIPALAPLAAGTVVAGRYTITQVSETEEPSEGAVTTYQAVDSRSYEECWSCGNTANGAGTRFCQNCGAPIQNHPVTLVQTREAMGLPHEVEQDGAFFHVQPERRLFGAEGIGVEVGAHSAEGPHHPNEDSYWYTTQTLCANSRRQSSAVVVFADGMGGYAPGSGLISSRIAAVVGSHIAAALAARSDDALESDEAESIVRGGIAAANKMVLEEIARTGEMGATLVTAVIYGDTCYLANVGDSRAYYVDSHGTITQITHDQSLVAQEVEQGHLGEDDIYTAAGNNIILHAVGEPEVEQAADWYTQPLEPGSYLVLCSDGYWKTMRGLVIREGLFGDNDTLGDVARALVDDALAHNSDDNTTVVLAAIS